MEIGDLIERLQELEQEYGSKIECCINDSERGQELITKVDIETHYCSPSVKFVEIKSK